MANTFRWFFQNGILFGQRILLGDQSRAMDTRSPRINSDNLVLLTNFIPRFPLASLTDRHSNYKLKRAATRVNIL
jgi:hypothetical protein